MSQKSVVHYQYTLKSATTLAGSYTEVCKLRMASLPGFDKTIIRVDEIHDEFEKKLGGKKLLTEATFAAKLTPANLTALITEWDRDPGADNKFYELGFPLEDAQSTAFALRFEGIVSRIDSAQIQSEATAAAEIPFTIVPSGDVTQVAAT